MELYYEDLIYGKGGWNRARIADLGLDAYHKRKQAEEMINRCVNALAEINY